MSENTIVPRRATTLSYRFLKQKGIEYIQQLAGKVWTDYNEHDPGITILEELCYAILDLEYRTNFYVEDLLAPDPNQAEEDTTRHFYYAEEILPCNPLTANDFLKLVVDVPGVRNAKILLSQGEQEIKGGYRVFLDIEGRAIQKGQEKQVIENVKQRLHQHRNLCEDFFEVTLLRPLHVRVNAALEVQSDITQEDSEKLYAEVLFSISSFIAPYINFYSLRNMLIDKKRTVEAIFTGPLLQQGFVDEQELEESGSRSIIYVSEILQKITEIDKIDNIIKFSIALEDEAFSKTVIEVPQDSVPRIDIERSNIAIYHNGSLLPINIEKAKLYLDEIINARIFKKPYLTEEEIAVREGRYRHLSSYTSIQHEFPLVYSVGREGLPASASKERKAQAKQLKAYLMFFDQLLANYLAQLAHAKDLLAVQSEVYDTYFSQIPEDVPGLESLMRYPDLTDQEDVNTGFKVQRKYLGFTPRMGTKKNKTQQELKREAYQYYLNKIVESKEHHRIKKNAILDHLLARFAEAFVDNAMFAYSSSREQTLKAAMLDKSLFLQDYITVSRDRNKGLDITDEASMAWGSNQVTGFERRVHRLLGIKNLERRSLYEALKSNFYVEQGFEHQSLEIFLGENLQSKYDNIFIFKGNFPQIRNLAVSQGINEENYDVTERGAGNYNIILYVDKNKRKSIELVNKQLKIKTIEQAKTLIKQAVRFFKTFNEESEGFHLVEHILLRNSTTFQGENDPYSFMMTLVFPAWPVRFQKASFRNTVHELVMSESPAHVFVNVLWLDPEEMETFERAYKEWIEIKGTRAADDAELHKVAKNLLGLIMLYSGEEE